MVTDVSTPGQDERTELSILMVCTGNICRSPAAELLLAHAFRAEPRVHVLSAGTGAVVGSGVAPLMLTRVQSRIGEAPAFTARSLTPTIARSAQLVLGMSTQHRSTVVSMVPAAMRRSFTLVEFAGLLQIGARQWEGLPTDPVERLLAGMTLANRDRSKFRVGVTQNDDITDPYGRSEQVYDEAFARVSRSVDAIVGFSLGL